MGRRGPKPKPPHLKILAGNPGGHAIGDGSPRVKSGVPRCPPRFAGTPARHIWKGLGKRLADAGILTPLDTFALELLVDASLAYSEAMKDGDEKRIDLTYKNMRQMLREFGLTPASRSHVSAADKPDTEAQPDPAARYFA